MPTCLRGRGHLINFPCIARGSRGRQDGVGWRRQWRSVHRMAIIRSGKLEPPGFRSWQINPPGGPGLRNLGGIA